jgi:beta-N-acetylhexosaminidase
MSFRPGQFLILGFRGFELEPEFRKFISEYPPAGYLLLGDNYKDRLQLKTLVLSLREYSGPHALIMVDQEPGRVQRFKDGFPASKSPDYYLKHSISEFKSWCSETAAVFAEIGVNVNLLPVLDLWAFDKEYPVLNGRSFGPDPEKVSEFGELAIEEFRKQGVFTCGKHFPGLGAAQGDPHEVLSRSDEKLERFLDYHWNPFIAAVKANVGLMMTTHLFCPSLDSTESATFSSNVINHLRYTIGHKGLIISDDLYMGGARPGRSMGEASIRAIEAGHNLLIISRDIGIQRESAESLKKRFEDGDSFGKIAAVNERAIENLFSSYK